MSKSKFIPFRHVSRARIIIWVSRTRKLPVRPNWSWKIRRTSLKLRGGVLPRRRTTNSRACSGIITIRTLTITTIIIIIRAKCLIRVAVSVDRPSIWPDKLQTRTHSLPWCSTWVQMRRSLRAVQPTITPTLICSDRRDRHKVHPQTPLRILQHPTNPSHQMSHLLLLAIYRQARIVIRRVRIDWELILLGLVARVREIGKIWTLLWPQLNWWWIMRSVAQLSRATLKTTSSSKWVACRPIVTIMETWTAFRIGWSRMRAPQAVQLRIRKCAP